MECVVASMRYVDVLLSFKVVIDSAHLTELSTAQLLDTSRFSSSAYSVHFFLFHAVILK
jgi:hypothetical protein